MGKTPKDPTEGQISLEDILAEFAPLDAPAPPDPDEEPTLRLFNKDGKLVAQRPLAAPAPEPEPEPKPEPKPEPELKSEPEPKPEPAPEDTPEKPEADPERKEAKLPWWKRKAKPVRVSEKVIELPGEDQSVTARIGRLIEKGDRYAQGMFQGDVPEEEEAERQRRERLLPGVDWESEPTHAPAPRRRIRRHARPDIAPGKLAMRYKKGLGFLHTRTFLTLLWCLPQLYLTLAGHFGLPLPAPIGGNAALQCQLAAVAMAVSALLALDVVIHAFVCLLRLRLESETLLLFAAAAAAADALTMPTLGTREGSMPYCAVVSVCFFFALWGRLLKRRALYQTCRAASGAAEPYLVTLDEKMWDGRDSYTKWTGTAEGYGSQVQDPDGVQRFYHAAAPLILIGAGLLALIASVGRQQPQLFFWCLSACLTAGCGLTAFLSFSMPYSALSRRLTKTGAALGGWDGVCWPGRERGVILTDTDLFPPGSVTLNGIKLTGEVSLETCLAYTTTLIRETGSGLAKPFSDMLRSKGGLCRKVSGVVFHEGGITGAIAGQNVFVGSGAFMELMKVDLPQGLKVKTAVFCAVDGKLCAIFALNYTLHPAVAPAIDALVDNGLDPILATRDFLIIPEMLRQRFKLPVNRMEFPSLDRRRELSSKRLEHERILTAVLCREGLGPYAEAVVGSKRLVWAVRVGIFFDLLAAVTGLGLSFYLCLTQAFAALSAGAMLVFLLLWLVPAALVAGWVNQY